MKNLILAALVLGTILTISSCKKITEPVAFDTIGNLTATVQGRAIAQINDTLLADCSNPDELVPDGTVLVLTLDLDQFPGVGNNGRDTTITTTVSGGTYSFTVPVPNDGASVSIYPQEFRATRYIDLNGCSPTSSNDTTGKYYSCVFGS